jgi:hypothetical protein
MKKFIIALIVVFIGVAGFLAYRLKSHGLVVNVTEKQIQDHLKAKFPIEKNYVLTRIALTDPKVTLKEGADRIHFRVTVSVSLPAKAAAKGSGEFSGEVKYDPEKGQFFLHDSKVEKLEISLLADECQDQVKEMTGMVAKELLNRYPIYKLQMNDPRQSMAKMFLKSVSVSHGKLEIVMGLM